MGKLNAVYEFSPTRNNIKCLTKSKRDVLKKEHSYKILLYNLTISETKKNKNRQLDKSQGNHRQSLEYNPNLDSLKATKPYFTSSVSKITTVRLRFYLNAIGLFSLK